MGPNQYPKAVVTRSPDIHGSLLGTQTTMFIQINYTYIPRLY